MTYENRARLIAAIAAPLFLLHATPGYCQSVPASAAAASAPMQMEHISITVAGRGSPVILIPGLATPRAVWDGVVPSLARTHRVYVVQVNGFGGDDPRANLQPGVLEGVVADLHELIVREKITGAAVVGHSMGGLIGLMLAREHAADVRRLMVVDSLPFIGALFSPMATVALVEPQAMAMRDRMVAGYGKPANPAVAQATAHQLASKPDAQALVAAWVGKADPRVSGEALYEDMTTDLRPMMAGIAVPITLIYPTSPAADPIYRASYKGAPHIRFVTVDDSAHFVMLDQPAKFASALDAFLAE